ncbi:MAG: hypothetical protein ACP5F3_06510 [Candidatus Syntrophosphaera sp.]
MNFLRIILGVGLLFICGNLVAQEQAPKRLIKLCEKIESLEEEIANMEDALSKVDSLLELHAQTQIVIDMARGGKPMVIEAPKLSNASVNRKKPEPAGNEQTSQSPGTVAAKTSEPEASAARESDVGKPPEAISEKDTHAEPEPIKTEVPEPAASKAETPKPAAAEPETSKPETPEPVATEPMAAQTESLDEAVPDPPGVEQSPESPQTKPKPRVELPPKDLRETWASLKKGMSEKDIRKLFGEPDKITDRVFCFWTYITKDGVSGYIYFDEGKVSGWREPHISTD